MPRFYFHYQYSNDRVLEDRVGTHLADLESVEERARSMAFEILCDELREGGALDTPRCLEVEDERGEVVLYLPFWTALAIAVEHLGHDFSH